MPLKGCSDYIRQNEYIRRNMNTWREYKKLISTIRQYDTLVRGYLQNPKYLFLKIYMINE